MALTKLSSAEFQTGAITTDKFSGDVALSMRIANVSIANSTYTVLDDTAVNVGGGYIVITGAGFQSGAQVIVDETPATSTTFVSSTELRAQVPAKSAATYDLFVVNTDGGTAIRVNGLTYSGIPTWVTASALNNQAVDVAFNVDFNATGATSYANTTVLPAGTTLLSNGYFYGTITSIESETTYNFTVSAIDAENQDSPREFSVTVTVGPNYSLYTWGGVPYATTYTTPTLFSNIEFTFVAVGSYHTLFIKPDKTLWAIGDNSQGELGLNDKISRSSPTQIGTDTNWEKVFSNYSARSSAAIKTDGTLWTWGENHRGQLCHNNLIYKSSPTQVGSLTWSQVSIGEYFTGITSNGTLYAAAIGVNSSSPVQLGNSVWTFVDQGFAIKNDGTLWGWGGNAYGEIGLNNRTSTTSPVQIGTGTNWSWVTRRSERRSFAIKTDGTLWTMGENSDGELGLNDRISRSSPTQIGTNTNWEKIATGQFAVAATKTAGTIWSWGFNNAYALGLGVSTATRSSPTQIGTDTNWIQPYSGRYFTTATKEV
jgi:alpha-tubulin suppressor-like RCC1 family protein